ncbi:MAG: hypothetical protein ABEK16_04370 [Candidatus Nanohalobium sp.]
MDRKPDYMDVKGKDDYPVVDIYDETVDQIHIDELEVRGSDENPVFTAGCGPCTGFLGFSEEQEEYFIGHSHPRNKRLGRWGEDGLVKELLSDIEGSDWHVEVFTGDGGTYIQDIPDSLCTVATFEHYMEENLGEIKIGAVDEPPHSLGGNRKRRDASRAVGKIEGEYQSAILQKRKNLNIV